MKRSFSIVAGAVALTLILIIAASAAWLHLELTIPYYNAPSNEIFVEIPRGLDTERIAKLLVESGILRHRLPFIAYLRFTNNAGRIKAGEYRFSDLASPKQVARRLIRGDVF